MVIEIKTNIRVVIEGELSDALYQARELVQKLERLQAERIPGVYEQVRALDCAGLNRIEIIKRVRSETGLCLKDAKDLVFETLGIANLQGVATYS